MTTLSRIVTTIALAILLGSTMFGPNPGAFAEETDPTPAIVDPIEEATPEFTLTPTETTVPEATATVESTVTVEPTASPTIEAPTATNVVPAETPAPSPYATTTAVVNEAVTSAQLTPRIGLSATSGKVGATIRIQVDDFPANKRIAIYFDGARKTTIVTSSTGRARGSFVVPVVAGGTHEIKANGGGRFAFKSFTVNQDLRISPTSVSAGGTLTASLTGFSANSTVKIRLYDINGTTVVSVWVAVTDGTGRATLSARTKLATVHGEHTVKAVGAGGTTAQTTITILARTATIETDILNLRAEPSTNGRILTQMLHGETVQILSTAGDWVDVRYNDRRGWTFGAYLAFGGDSASFWVPVHQQQHSLSCEYASLQIATSALGNEVPEDEFISVVGSDNNPHYGFRGDIDGVDIFGTDDYGVYPEALADALPTFGFNGKVFYGGTSRLKSHLRAGTPVVIWIDLGFNTSFTMIIDGEPVTMAPRSHVVVAYGFSDEGVLISDPDSSTRKRLIPWDDFNIMWSSMDQMALAVTR